jgi:hypothetical protein
MLLACLVIGCGSGTIADNPDGSSAPPSDARVVDAPLTLTFDAPPGGGGIADARIQANDAGQALCDDHVCECSDAINNDTDGFIDAADPECSGPFDDDEATFGTGIPGDNSDPNVQDCFFDGDSGGGNDGCRWDIRCTDPPSGQHCNNNQVAGCDSCRPLVPNGCDCFGCCDVFVGGVPHTVRIEENCTVAEIDNPDLCPPCTKVTACENPCETCEVCLNRPPDPSCALNDAGVPQVCEAPKFPCGPDNTCPSSDYRCITGCCVKFLQ